jgi:ABC-type Fe3+ transport system permease subunit
MEGLIVALGVIALLITAYSFWRDGRQEKRDVFGRIRMGTWGTWIWIKPWVYYLLAMFCLGCVVVIIAIGVLAR